MFYLALTISKQAIHQMLDRRMVFNEEVGFLNQIVYEIRQDHPTLSLRAMYYKILPQSIGRDKFEALCRDWGYGISRSINYQRTTNSNGVIRFENHLEGLMLTGINQAISSDITYFELGELFYYITFIMDCFSRMILGYSVSKRLTTEQTTIPAMKMVIKVRKGNIQPGMIFHSDGGGQYYDKEFLAITTKYQLINSMCEYPWENGKAERINGIIKNNYLKYWTINTFDELSKSVDRAVSLYNSERPHKSLNYATPLAFEKKQLLLEKQTTPKMTESFDAIVKSNGASSPFRLEQTTPQNRDVFYAINELKEE
jgi:transposase InsO family protein